MKHLLLSLTILSSLGLSTTSVMADTPPAMQIETKIPAGAYKMDRAHSSLIFRVNHMGFSNFTARFKHIDGQLQFDPANAGNAQLTATVDARSIETDYPEPQKFDFNSMLQNEQWLDTKKFPEITFKSTKIEVTGKNTGHIIGDLTLHGVTHPVTLDVTFNGGYGGLAGMDPQARVGFSAHGSLKRSDFGIAFGIPAAGTTMGVSDNVDIIIETEFNGPALPAVKK